MNYKPEFSITDEMTNIVDLITRKLKKLKAPLDMDNRVKAIHATLRIEANSLSLSEVRDVIDNHLVIGDQVKIQEVKNAYNAYNLLTKIDPYSSNDLKKLHGIMTNAIVSESGTFRRGAEAVYRGSECIFIAPPASMVSPLINDLLNWMKNNKRIVHPLILSAIFHYEFVYIHPFSDGNGRMARLWQSAILYNWKKIFEFVPLESQIEKYQEDYYKAIMQSHYENSCNAFIEFMLSMIDKTLEDVINNINKFDIEASEYVKRLLNVMEDNVPYTANSLLEKLCLKSKDTLRKNYIEPAINLNLIRMTLPDKKSSKNQRYVKE